jgi:hypothetical protein
MKGDKLDEYIVDFSTIIGELGWNYDSEISCHSFREGLAMPLAREIIKMEGIPESLTGWIKFAQKYHLRWAMSRAFRYQGKKEPSERFKPHSHQQTKKKEHDPDAMDIDFTQLSPDKKEQFMKSGSCFRCEKQGHLSRNCPSKNKMAIREAKIEATDESPKKWEKKKHEEEPPSYDSLLKQINACSMEDRQKLLEVFFQDGSEPEDF